jgi:hypothetical protein
MKFDLPDAFGPKTPATGNSRTPRAGSKTCSRFFASLLAANENTSSPRNDFQFRTAKDAIIS